MLRTIVGFIQRQRQASHQRKADRERKQKLDKINEFQKAYVAGGDIMSSEYTYQVIQESSLATMTDDELDALLTKCAEGQEYIKSVEGEIAFRTEADNPSHEYKVVFIAPRNSMWLEYSRYAGDIDPADRHCLVLLKILLYYGYMTAEDFRSAAIAFLGSPTRKFADPNRQNRGFENVHEVMDRPYLDSIQGARLTPKSYGYEKAQAFLNKQLQERPRSVRLNRLKKEFQAKGVIST